MALSFLEKKGTAGVAGAVQAEEERKHETKLVSSGREDSTLGVRT